MHSVTTGTSRTLWKHWRWNLLGGREYPGSLRAWHDNGLIFNSGDISLREVLLCPAIVLPRYSSIRLFLLLLSAFSAISIIFVTGWAFYICNSRFFFPLGFRATPCCFYISTAHQMSQALEIVLGCFLGMGVRGSLWDFSLCSLRFWRHDFLEEGVGRKFSEPTFSI